MSTVAIVGLLPLMLGGAQPSIGERGVEFDNVRPSFSGRSAARGPIGTPSIDASAGAATAVESVLPELVAEQPDSLKLLDKAAREKHFLRRSELVTKVMRQILSSASEPDAQEAVNTGLRRVLATFDREGTFFPRESLADSARSGSAEWTRKRGALR